MAITTRKVQVSGTWVAVGSGVCLVQTVTLGPHYYFGYSTTAPEADAGVITNLDQPTKLGADSTTLWVRTATGATLDINVIGETV